jgi:hypothetical protein
MEADESKNSKQQPDNTNQWKASKPRSIINNVTCEKEEPDQSDNGQKVQQKISA